MIIYVLTSCGIIAVAVVFFKKFGVSDKSMAPWTSREFNRKCILRDFYDAHDCWHLFASFGLMLVTMLCVQVSILLKKTIISVVLQADNDFNFQ